MGITLDNNPPNLDIAKKLVDNRRNLMMTHASSRPLGLPNQINKTIDWLKDHYPAGNGLAYVKVEHFPNGRGERDCPCAVVTVNGQAFRCTFPELPPDFNQKWIEEA